MSDHFRTPAHPVEVRLKIERSEFLGIVFPVSSEEAFFAELHRIQKKYFDATHHCWAFRLFEEARSRSSDAGEPSGTAGKPILAAVEGAGVHDAGVIVVRWYGGIKLGTGGLSRAYRDTTAAALRKTPLLDRFVYERIRVAVPFDALSTVYRMIAPPDVLLAEESYGEENVFSFDVRLSKAEEFRKALEEKRLRALP